MGVIYVRPNLINGKKYVGQATTKNFKSRQNRWNNLTKPYAGKAINNARAKYGVESFGFEILKECDDKELDYWEKYYIKELNTKVPNGYNMTDGGEGRSGSSVSEETRKKLSKANKGRKMSPRSEETLKKMSESHKGRKTSEETRKKISRTLKGKKRSEETKKKIGEANKGKESWIKGKHHTEETRKKMSEIHFKKEIFQIDLNTGQIIMEFQSLMEVQRQLGYEIGNLSKCCNGKRKTAYGYIWKYKESVA